MIQGGEIEWHSFLDDSKGEKGNARDPDLTTLTYHLFLFDTADIVDRD
jgi:hypothetical protein